MSHVSWYTHLSYVHFFLSHKLFDFCMKIKDTNKLKNWKNGVKLLYWAILSTSIYSLNTIALSKHITVDDP